MASPVTIGFRNSSLVPPLNAASSARAVAASNGMNGAVSLRALLDKRDRSLVRRVGVWICTPTDQARSITQPAYWYDRLFGDRLGIATFFREMSGGRHYIEWQVYEQPLLSTAQKAAADAGGASGAIAAFRAAAQAVLPAGQSVSDYDRFVWVLDDGTANGGVTVLDTLLTAKDGSVALFSHEMTHGFGLCPHADRYLYSDYLDPFCIMGGLATRSFVNTRLTVSGAPADLGVGGPGICAPYLFALQWLDYDQHVVSVTPDRIAQNTGGTKITIHPNRGAPSGPGRPIALALGNLPANLNDPSQFWIEYRTPGEFDRTIDTVPGANMAEQPGYGVLVLHQVDYLSQLGCTSLHSYVLQWIGAAVGQRLGIPAFNIAVRVAGVNPLFESVTLVLDPQ